VGRAIALALAGAGMRVALHYHRSAAAARQTQAELEALGVEALAFPADLTVVAEAEGLVDSVVAHWGQLDLLVCSAARWERTPLGSVSAEQWDGLFDLNVRSVFFLAQRAAPHLQATGGSIVAIADASTAKTWAGYSPYLASKAALAMLVQNLARDLAPHVRVNAIAPGPVLLPDDWNDSQRERAARSTLLQRVGTPDDVAQAVLYLAQAPFVTGVVLPVDGGMGMR
jgi:pteridine reductase